MNDLTITVRENIFSDTYRAMCEWCDRVYGPGRSAINIMSNSTYGAFPEFKPYFVDYPERIYDPAIAGEIAERGRNAVAHLSRMMEAFMYPYFIEDNRVMF